MSDAPRHPSLRDSAPAVYWLDDPTAPAAADALGHDTSCDLVVVGAGLTGLWTALLARIEDPSADVVVLDSRRAAAAASGRNGGFCDASLTHGFGNGLARFASDLATLERLGMENLDAIASTVRDHGIDCDLERTGTLDAALAPWQVEEMAAVLEPMRAHGYDVTLLDGAGMRRELDSPTYRGGLWTRGRTAIVNPARLVWGLRRLCLERGVRLFEDTRVTALESTDVGVHVRTPRGTVRARRVALATNADRPLLARLRPFILPVYDHVLVSEPLSTAQLRSIGWRNRQGVSDGGNQFHYYRLTADSRLLWGGYDAVYHFGNRVDPGLEERARTFDMLARHCLATFPQLEGLRFTHRWAGVIDTCSRFCAFWGTAHRGRVAYVTGYTGLGVGASRFGAQVMLDLLAGRATERTALGMVRTRPLPFPPEPLRFAVVQLTRWSLTRADRHQGRRNAWLRALDAAGLGFDS